jgi:hypothetical protein
LICSSLIPWLVGSCLIDWLIDSFIHSSVLVGDCWLVGCSVYDYFTTVSCWKYIL